MDGCQIASLCRDRPQVEHGPSKDPIKAMQIQHVRSPIRQGNYGRTVNPGVQFAGYNRGMKPVQSLRLQGGIPCYRSDSISAKAIVQVSNHVGFPEDFKGSIEFA